MDQNQAVNQLISLQDKKDKEMEDLLNKVLDNTQLLESDMSRKQKYDIVISVEYLLFRLRLLVEFESITVKKILNSSDLLPYIRSIFTKRDVYLSQFSMKLNTISNDVANIQKLMYSQTFKL